MNFRANRGDFGHSSSLFWLLSFFFLSFKNVFAEVFLPAPAAIWSFPVRHISINVHKLKMQPCIHAWLAVHLRFIQSWSCTDKHTFPRDCGAIMMLLFSGWTWCKKSASSFVVGLLYLVFHSMLEPLSASFFMRTLLTCKMKAKLKEMFEPPQHNRVSHVSSRCADTQLDLQRRIWECCSLVSPGQKRKGCEVRGGWTVLFSCCSKHHDHI